MVSTNACTLAKGDEDHLEGLGERRLGMARWRWSWGIGELYQEQMRRAEPRKKEEKERRERMEEGEPKEEMQRHESEKAREEREGRVLMEGNIG